MPTVTLTLAVFITLILTSIPLTRGVKATNCTCVSEGGKVVSADCSGLGWTRVPRSLPPSLISLNLSGNKLVTLQDSPYSGYPRLETLDLSQNQIVRLENSSFTGLSRLRWLSLRLNGLRMLPRTFPVRAFEDLKELQVLDLHLNQPNELNPNLTYPDAALASLTSLKTLRMDGLATNVDLGPGFSKLQQLEVLDINDDTGVCMMTSLSERFFYHVNTSRPLTVNLTDCKLRSIHNKTFSFLPTLHTLDLCSNRHLNFPPFVQASQSLWKTQIKVLDISKIHRTDNIKIEAEDFMYLGYTWLESLSVNDVQAFDIALRAMFNLPTSLKYLSLYNNKLINATCAFGLYLLPHIETLQISRQNHFSSRSELTTTQQDNSTDLRFEHHVVPGKSQVAAQNNKQHEEAGRYNAGFQTNNTNLLFVPGSSKISQSMSSEYSGATKKHPSFRPAESVVRSMTSSRDNSRPSHGRKRAVNTISSSGFKFLHQKKNPRNRLEPETNKATPSSFSNSDSYSKKRINKRHNNRNNRQKDGGSLPHNISDPSVCLSHQFVKDHESRLYEYLDQLKAFLLKYNVHFNKTTDSDGFSITSWTALQEPPSYTDTNVRQHQHGSGPQNMSRPENQSNVQEIYLPWPPTMRFLFASELKLGYVLPRIYFLYNRLEIINISKNNLPCFLGPFLGLHKLRSLDLSNNFAVYVSQDFFQDMPSLTHLYLQGNFLGDSFANDSTGKILNGLKNLQVLHLNDNSIKGLSDKAFLAQKNMTYLSLARNALRHFTPRVGHMTGLNFLDLSENSIGFLENQVLEELGAISTLSNLTVDLHHNPLSCSCDSLDFWYWVTRNKSRVHVHRVEEYVCTLENGSQIDYGTVQRELDSLWLQCQGQRFFGVVLSVFVGLLFLLSLLGVLHYKRWRLRYFYYVGLRRLRHPYDCHHVYRHAVDDVKDVFISFDDDSGDCRIRRFVHEVLQPEFQRQGLSYYTSEVQFANRPIKDIIPDAILGARKTLAIFSAHFFPSYERELEFNMAVYHELILHRQVIVPAVMGPVDWSIFPPEVLVYLEEHACIPYRQEEEAAFIETLVTRIRMDIRL